MMCYASVGVLAGHFLRFAEFIVVNSSDSILFSNPTEWEHVLGVPAVNFHHTIVLDNTIIY